MTRKNETSLVGLTRDEIKESLKKFDIPESQINMRVNQIWGWVYHKGISSIDEMTTLSLELRDALKKYHNLERPVISNEKISEDGTKKWLLKFTDGSEVETVFIPDSFSITIYFQEPNIFFTHTKRFCCFCKFLYRFDLLSQK